MEGAELSRERHSGPARRNGSVLWRERSKPNPYTPRDLNPEPTEILWIDPDEQRELTNPW